MELKVKLESDLNHTTLVENRIDVSIQIKTVTCTQTEEFIRVPFLVPCCFSRTSTVFS
jgi:hypothetical protein